MMPRYLQLPKDTKSIIQQLVFAVAPEGPQVELLTLLTRNSLVTEYICYGNGLVLSVQGKLGHHVNHRPLGHASRTLVGVTTRLVDSFDELQSSPFGVVNAEQLRFTFNELWFLIYNSKHSSSPSEEDEISNFALLHLGDERVVNIDNCSTVRRRNSLESYLTHEVAAAGLWVEAPSGESAFRYLNVRELLKVKVSCCND
jgi:hypothetical protein